MPKQNKIYITSDTHFDHSKLIRMHYRPVDFQETIIESWKKTVKPNDLIIHLGDVVVGNNFDWDILKNELPGKKVLVCGNHDKKSYMWYLDHGFDFACTKFSLEIYGLDILFSHEPVLNLNGHDINIHGHLHNEVHRGVKPSDRHILISLERLNYQVVSLEKIVNNWINR